MIEPIFYNTEYNNEVFDIECTTPQEAEVFMDEWWDERCEASGVNSASDTYELIAFVYTYEGDILELTRVRRTMEYESYHGDYAEHNIYWAVL